MKASYYQLGDSALEIQLEEHSIHHHLALRKHLLDQNLDGIREITATKSSVCVFYDPALIHPDQIKQENVQEIEVEKITIETALIRIPVCYDQEYGFDLPEVSRLTDLSIDQIIESHSSQHYQVAMFGFIPGFPYLDGLDDNLILPRKSSPTVRIPGGSVGIATNKSGIYPFEVPGGWYILGRTPLDLVDWTRDNPFLMSIGDPVEFYPISKSQFIAWND